MNILRLLNDLYGNAFRRPVECPVERPRLPLTDLPYDILYLIFMELETTTDVKSFALISQETHHAFKKAYPQWMKVRYPLITTRTTGLLQMDQMWDPALRTMLPRWSAKELLHERCLCMRELVRYLERSYFSKAVDSADLHFSVGGIGTLHPDCIVLGAEDRNAFTHTFHKWIKDNERTMVDRVHWLTSSELTFAQTEMATKRDRIISKKNRKRIQFTFGRFDPARWKAEAGIRFYLTDYWVLIIVCFTRRPATVAKVVGSSS